MLSYQEQAEELEEELRTTKYNKATQHHIGLLKAKLARLREKREGAGGKKGQGYSVRKAGDATVILAGFPSVGKSTILNKITNAESKVADYAFTTLTVIPGVMDYNHAKIQVLDVPGLIKGAASGAGMGKEVMSVIRSSDLVVFVTEPFSLKQVEVLKDELYKAGIRIDTEPPNVKIKRAERGGVDLASTVMLTKIDRETVEGILKEFSFNNASVVIREDVSAERFIDAVQGNKVYVASLVVVNKADMANDKQLKLVRRTCPDALIMSAKNDNPEKLKRAIFEKLKLMRVFMKQAGKKADMEVPLIVKQGSTIGDVCNRLHRDFTRRFRNAKVWGQSAKFPGQVLHGSHVLMDKDVVQINLR
ncbi:GTP-binding protein [Candidatus Woesearchaeota archaeon]|nr:GTP-binding protein [Candidatus Woesearchaeota archaeon]